MSRVENLALAATAFKPDGEGTAIMSFIHVGLVISIWSF